MNPEANSRFEAANKKIHPVESQWHYQILTKHGFAPLTKDAAGFVRCYEYQHPSGRKIRASTGANADWWIDMETKKQGYWSTLDSWLDTLMKDGG